MNEQGASIWKRGVRNAAKKEEGVVLATNVETFGVDLRTRTKQLGAKEKARRKKCDVRLSLIGKHRAFGKIYMRTGVRRLCVIERLRWRRQMAGAAAGKEESALGSEQILKSRKNFPPRPCLLGRNGSGCENGKKKTTEGMEETDL